MSTLYSDAGHPVTLDEYKQEYQRLLVLVETLVHSESGYARGGVVVSLDAYHALSDYAETV